MDVWTLVSALHSAPPSRNESTFSINHNRSAFDKTSETVLPQLSRRALQLASERVCTKISQSHQSHLVPVIVTSFHTCVRLDGLFAFLPSSGTLSRKTHQMTRPRFVESFNFLCQPEDAPFSPPVTLLLPNTVMSSSFSRSITASLCC